MSFYTLRLGAVTFDWRNKTPVVKWEFGGALPYRRVSQKRHRAECWEEAERGLSVGRGVNAGREMFLANHTGNHTGLS